MKRYITLFALGLYMTTWLPAQEVARVQVGDTQTTGITYNLPLTMVRVVANASCTTVKAGIFAPYAEKYLGVKDAPMEDRVTWSITSVIVEAEALADTSRTYHINFVDKTAAPTFYLAPGNILVGINREPERKCEIETLANAPESPKPAVSAINVMTEELLKAGSRTKQAEIAARQIFRIRESRLNILTGDVDNLPADGESFHIVLDNLAAQEAAYMELFTGTSATTTTQREFLYRPAQEGSEVLFRFSRHFGFVDADDLSGEPYNITVQVTDDKRTVPVHLDAKGKAKPQATGVAYVVPGRARISIAQRGKSWAEVEWPMAQFGHVEFLPATQFVNKKAPSAAATLCPLTGALQLFQNEK